VLATAGFTKILVNVVSTPFSLIDFTARQLFDNKNIFQK
jgi:hypothetical protein